MTDSTNTVSSNQTEGTPPSLPLTLNIQFTKDLSFEVPHGAAIFASLQEAPQISVSIDTNANRLNENGVYEVSLKIKIDAVEAQNKMKVPVAQFLLRNLSTVLL